MYSILHDAPHLCPSRRRSQTIHLETYKNDNLHADKYCEENRTGSLTCEWSACVLGGGEVGFILHDSHFRSKDRSECCVLGPAVLGTPRVMGIWSFRSQTLETSSICQAFCQTFCVPHSWVERNWFLFRGHNERVADWEGKKLNSSRYSGLLLGDKAGRFLIASFLLAPCTWNTNLTSYTN